MRASTLLLPLVVAACAAPPAPVRSPPPPPLTAAPPPAPAATTRYAEPVAPPAFADPERKAKLVAVVPQLDAHFAELATKAHYPGLAVGLVIDGELVWSKGYGVRDLESKEPVDADTVFRLASITKSFTGMALLQLRDEGKVSLDEPAQKYLPELAGLVYPTRDAPAITLRNLLTHLAGLPHDSPVDRNQSHAPTDEQILKSLQGMTLIGPPNVHSAYSNLGFELAGMVVARVSGMPYRDYLVSHVLGPLGMTSSGFEPPMNRLATGYRMEHDALKHPPRLELGANPAGGLFSTVRDLARYAAFQLAAWPPRDDADAGPLRRSSVREAQRMSTWWSLEVFPRMLGKAQRATATGYGFGWLAQETCEWDTVVWHNGGLSDGYHSVLYMLPDRGVAIVALTNLDDEPHALDQGARDGMRLLDASGALAKRVVLPTPALRAARDAVLPPDPRLEAAAARLASLVQRWDDQAYDALAAPSVERAHVKAAFAEAATMHGSCRVDHAGKAGDKTHGRFALTCARGGPSELRATLDDQTGKVTDVLLVVPSEEGKKCP